MPEWIGRELERIRKLRGLRREDVAARMARPVSASTIRNIEHDEDYNVSLDLLRQIAAVLGAKIQVSLEAEDLNRWHTPPGQRPAIELADVPAEGQERLIDNEYFIRYIRARYPDCPLTNSQIGRRMWDFAKPRGAELVKGRMQAVSYTHLRAHETRHDLVCRLLLEKKKKKKKKSHINLHITY